MKAQWEKRLEVTIVIYQYLLLDLSKQELFDTNQHDFGFEIELDKSSYEIIEYVIDNQKQLEAKIIPILNKTWTWERMSFFDRAIILEALAESEVLNTPKPVLIDQALITARKYHIDDSYKYINALLEKLIICKDTL